ncbi:MAG: DUF2087 domain-containing protein [Pseudolysinimonas sp.]
MPEIIPPDVGVAKFLRRSDGRIDRYPRRLVERGLLLRWIAERAFHADERLTEAEVNDRLMVYADDVATLRRYLVDHQLLDRDADGSRYRLCG